MTMLSASVDRVRCGYSEWVREQTDVVDHVALKRLQFPEEAIGDLSGEALKFIGISC